jgi:uncharacterized membrane protein
VNDPNPYSAPQSTLEAPLVLDAAGFLGEPRRLPTGAGVDWLRGGWELFQKAPGAWIGLFVVWVLVFMAVSFVPIVGGIAANLLMLLMMGGIALGCEELRAGGELRIGHLFAAWDTPARGPLLLLGVFYLIASMVVAVVMIVLMFMMFGGVAMLGGGSMDESRMGAAMLPMMAVFVVVMLALFLPLGMAIWLAPPLVTLNGLEPIAAMKASFAASLRNFDVLIVYGLLTMLVTFVAILPLGLGLLVSSPVLLAAGYVGYRQIYYDAP